MSPGSTLAVPCWVWLPMRRDELGRIDLAAGDRLVLFTDGIVEASRGTEEFGDDRLVSLIAAHRDASAREIVTRIVEAVTAFSGTADADDTTLLVLAVD